MLIDTLSADFPYGEKFYIAGKNIFAISVLVKDKYFKMHEAAKITLFKLKTKI
jgi:hypothetical protein